MKQSPLARFIENMQAIWGPLDSNLIAKSQTELDSLTKDPDSVPWLKDLQTSSTKSSKLYRDPKHGFILLAQAEAKGLHQNSHGDRELLRREVYRVKHGESRVYLPGDIHDTKCVSDSVLMLRLTSCDLDVEKEQGRMHKYPAQN